MHEAPAPVDRRVVEQPLDRARVADREAILHLADLLGDVDVHRHRRREPLRWRCRQLRDPVEYRVHRIGLDRAQRMQCDAYVEALRLQRAQAFDQAQETVDVMVPN